MSTDFEKLSDEEKESWLEQNIASTKFLRLRKAFRPCDANAKKMAELLKKENLPWTLESLEQVFEKHRDEFELQAVKELPAPAPVAEAPPEPPAPELPEWGILTRASIAAMSPETYQHWYNNKFEDVRVEFRNQVNRVLAGKSQFGGAR